MSALRVWFWRGIANATGYAAVRAWERYEAALRLHHKPMQAHQRYARWCRWNRAARAHLADARQA